MEADQKARDQRKAQAQAEAKLNLAKMSNLEEGAFVCGVDRSTLNQESNDRIKGFLSKHGMPTTGKKSELITRALKFLQTGEVAKPVKKKRRKPTDGDYRA